MLKKELLSHLLELQLKEWEENDFDDYVDGLMSIFVTVSIKLGMAASKKAALLRETNKNEEDEESGNDREVKIRTDLVSEDSNEDYDDSDYEEGYQDGLEEGRLDGYDKGYKEGYHNALKQVKK